MINVYEADENILDSVYHDAVSSGYDDITYENIMSAYNLASAIAKKYGTTVDAETFPIGFGIDISKMDVKDVDEFYNTYASENSDVAEHYDYYTLSTPYPAGGKYSRVYLSYVKGSNNNAAGVSVGELT